MKRNLRYAASGLFVAALLVLLFAPLIDVSVVELSLTDVLKLGSGIGDSGVWGSFGNVLEEYMKPYFFLVLFLILLLLAGALSCALLRWRSAYLAAVVGVAAVNIVAAISVWTLYSKIKDLRQGLSFFGMEGVIRIHKGPIVLWMILCLAILAIGIWGLLQAAQMPGETKGTEILPESFGNRKNPWEDRQDLTAQVNQMEKAGQNHKARESHRAGQNLASPDSISSNPVSQNPAIPFHGALKGLGGIYRGKIYPMEEKLPVYFVWDGHQAVVSEEKEEGFLAEVYYVSEYGEYCLTPQEGKACFLESGQPLGAGRHYYLRRGTQICVKEKSPVFELA